MTDDNDPFANLENHVRRKEAEEKAAEAMATARVKLVLAKDAGSVFFATLALRLQTIADWSVQTMCTDGKKLRYNPAFTNSLPPEEVKGVITHEVMHNALQHHTRRGARDPENWNVAADLVINPTLREAGYSLPSCCLLPGKAPYQDMPSGLSTEATYDLLPKGKGKGPDGTGSDPGRCGGVSDASKDGDDSENAEAEAEAQVAVAQAHQAAKLAEKAGRGKLPGGIDRMVAQILAPKVDWRNVLREFVTRQSRNDYAWSPPNRRHVWQGLYLPGLRSEELGDVVVAVDTSGSVGGEMFQRFASEMQGILDGFDCKMDVVYHDHKIQHHHEWRSTDGDLVLEAKGGGGTSHVPVFEWVDKLAEPPSCVVCLTDLYTEFPSKSPAYPVLWCVVDGASSPAPFGQTLKVE